MTEQEFEQIRDKDHVVLQHIKEGREDVQKITAETTLENHHISYSFEKLEELGLITVEKPDRMVERVVNGQKRVFQHPKKAELTEKGNQYIKRNSGEVSLYEDLNRRELVQKVKKLDKRVESLESSLSTFKKQIQNQLS